MNSIDLNSQWVKIGSSKDKNGYKALRVSSTSLSDLFIAIDNEGLRCLILYLPHDLKINLKEIDKNKLLISFLPSKALLLIKLKDFDFIDLFNDLIISIYSKTSLISDAEKASDEFIKTFYKWSQFFEDSYKPKLGEEQIQGLFGELFVLKEHIKNSAPASINYVLTSWKGLYNATNDFEFDHKNIEVKTKKEAKQLVKISSEFQLEKELDKGLELWVVSVIIDLFNGRSIHDVLLEIIIQVRESLGELSILYQALNQKGLTVDNLKQYNNHRFIVTKIESFDTVQDDFPKLSQSNIPNEISSLSYSLRISQLDNFLIEMKKY